MIGADGMHEHDRGAITTWSGRAVNPLTCGPDDISIADIAHSLARLCRYNGHVTQFLPVAHHSVEVSWVLNEWNCSPLVQLQGLLHDSAEAYLGDLVRPLKEISALGAAYREAEERLERVIFEHFGLPFPLDEAVKQADTFVLLNVEMGGLSQRWNWDITPANSELIFLRRFKTLMKEIGR